MANEKKDPNQVRDYNKYMGYITESFLFMDDADRSKLLFEVSDLKVQKDAIDEKLSAAREKLRDAMVEKGSAYAFDMEKGFYATISAGRQRTKQVFDEDAFKRDNPDLYSKYVRTEVSCDSKDLLRINKVTENHKKWFALDDLSKYVVTRETEFGSDEDKKPVQVEESNELPFSS